jgi:hypothetical protein
MPVVSSSKRSGVDDWAHERDAATGSDGTQAGGGSSATIP